MGEQHSNGAMRYLAVNSLAKGSPKRDDTPPFARRFIGSPEVFADVYTTGRVDLTVRQLVELPGNKRSKDNYLVAVSRKGSVSVRHFPTTATTTSGIGPQGPFRWMVPAKRTVPDEVLAIINEALPQLAEKLPDRLKGHLVTAAEQLGLKVGITTFPRTTTTTLFAR